MPLILNGIAYEERAVTSPQWSLFPLTRPGDITRGRFCAFQRVCCFGGLMVSIGPRWMFSAYDVVFALYRKIQMPPTFTVRAMHRVNYPLWNCTHFFWDKFDWNSCEIFFLQYQEG